MQLLKLTVAPPLLLNPPLDPSDKYLSCIAIPNHTVYHYRLSLVSYHLSFITRFLIYHMNTTYIIQSLSLSLFISLSLYIYIYTCLLIYLSICARVL